MKTILSKYLHKQITKNTIHSTANYSPHFPYNRTFPFNNNKLLLKAQHSTFVVNHYKKQPLPNPQQTQPKIYKYRRFNGEADTDKQHFTHSLRQAKQQITETYWKEQSLIEKAYFTGHYEAQKQQQHTEKLKSLNFILSQAQQCTKEIEQRKLQHDRFLAKQNVWRIEESVKHTENQALLHLIDRDAASWLTPSNFYQNISTVIDQILPHTIISHRDYYNKVNKYAVLMDKGLVEQAEVLKNTSENAELKNKLIEPVFGDLKKMIRNMSRNPEHVFEQKYNDIKRKVGSLYGDTAEGREITGKFRQVFLELVEKQREVAALGDNKIMLIEKTITGLVNVCLTWNKYVELLYLSDEEISKMGSGGVGSRDIDLLDEEKDDEVDAVVGFDSMGSGVGSGRSGGIGSNDGKSGFVKDGVSVEDEHKKKIIENIFNSEINSKSNSNSTKQEKKKARQTSQDTKETKETKENTNKSETKKAKAKTKEKEASNSDLPINEAKDAKEAKEAKSRRKSKSLSGTLNEKKVLLLETKAIFEDDTSESKYNILEKIDDFLKENTTEKDKYGKMKIDKSATKADSGSSSSVSDGSGDVRSNDDSAKKERKGRKEKKDKVKNSSDSSSSDTVKLDEVVNQKNEERKAKNSVAQEIDSLLNDLDNLKGLYDEAGSKVNNSNNANRISEYSLRVNTNEGFFNEDILSENDSTSKLGKDSNDSRYGRDSRDSNDSKVLDNDGNIKQHDYSKLFSSDYFNNILKYVNSINEYNSFPTIDIYDQTLFDYLEHAILEAVDVQKKVSCSLVMKFLESELNSIDDSTLTPENRIKKKHFIRLAKLMSYLPIQDSQNFKKVFDMYRLPTAKIN